MSPISTSSQRVLHLSYESAWHNFRLQRTRNGGAALSVVVRGAR